MTADGPVNTVTQWSFRHGDQTYGPVPEELIRQWLESGRIPADALLSPGNGTWITVEQFRQQSPASPAPTATSEPAAAAAAAQPEATSPHLPPAVDPLPERDRIVVIGRRQAGKTVYLATLYEKLWHSLDDLHAKALTGAAHAYLMQVHQTLKAGQWPPSTLGTSRLELELNYHGQKYLMVGLDFAGELFAKAFVDEQMDWPGVKELVNHIDRAAAVILLVDPSVAAGVDGQAVAEDDFGLVQAVQRIRNWPGGNAVPIILAFTKADLHRKMVESSGGSEQFIRKHFPALVRTLRQVPYGFVSAVQVDFLPDGRTQPRPDSAPRNIDYPLRFCLEHIEKARREAEETRAEQERTELAERLKQAEVNRERRQTLLLVFAIAAICGAGLITILLLLFFR